MKPNGISEWGIEKIYKTRAEKNADSDPHLRSIQYKLDAVAFGLKSFRNLHVKEISHLLDKGIYIRILTMDPSEGNPYLAQREREENETPGQIRKSILDLVDWADKLNQVPGRLGKIEIRGYRCMTLDFYWRMDNEIYVGPYWYGIDSQQTITFKFSGNKKGFILYSDYFDKLWHDQNNTIILTR